MRFKMRPLKLENEVGSNMKSTIRYTFVAPSSIGKGRGRGLKSLGEKGNVPTKSLLPQSSDLVKQYINDIETNSTGKDQGQGLKNRTMPNSQGMRMTHKNFMTSEKGNMQINTSSPTSINQVKKYTQAVETSATGKRLEQRSGSLISSLEIFEYEVGSFNKIIISTNLHVRTPSKSAKSSSTMSSSQEIQKMRKLVLEKEDMQTKVSLPPSSDQVMKHSQTNEKGSSNPTKVKKV